MSIEKGISRIGTILGIFFGFFLATLMTGLYPPNDIYKYFLEKQNMREHNEFLTNQNSTNKDKEIEKLNIELYEYSFEKEPKSVFIAVYLPTFMILILTMSFLFLFGFLIIKWIERTLNWVIAGFRE